jgi:hypothetical protein
MYFGLRRHNPRHSWRRADPPVQGALSSGGRNRGTRQTASGRIRRLLADGRLASHRQPLPTGYDRSPNPRERLVRGPRRRGGARPGPVDGRAAAALAPAIWHIIKQRPALRTGRRPSRSVSSSMIPIQRLLPYRSIRSKLSDAHRKISVAAKPRPVRRAWRLAHFLMSLRL